MYIIYIWIYSRLNKNFIGLQSARFLNFSKNSNFKRNLILLLFKIFHKIYKTYIVIRKLIQFPTTLFSIKITIQSIVKKLQPQLIRKFISHVKLFIKFKLTSGFKKFWCQKIYIKYNICIWYIFMGTKRPKN